MATVEVKARADQEYRQEISTATHSFASDAPKEAGGSDSAPNPHELLLGSLGACTAITVQMYAKRKGWPLKGVNVKVEEQVVETDGKKQSLITRNIELEGELDQEQIDGLRAIADKCPIHKLLQGPKEIKTEVAHK
jgi:putative redox protein